MTVPGDPIHPSARATLRDEEARKKAGTATVIAAVAAVIAVVALILAFVHMQQDFAPANCDPATDYVCRPETSTATSTTQVPSTSMSPTSTEVPVPTSSPSEVVTTTVKP